MNKKTLSDSQIQWLKDNYATLGAAACGKELNKTSLQIITFIKNNKLGLLVAKDTRSKILKGSHQPPPLEHYGVHPAQFFEVKTAEVSYLLGLLWADGYVYRNVEKSAFKVVLETEAVDFMTFQKALDFTGRWAIYERDRGKSLIKRAVAFNKPLVEFLTALNYTSKNDSADLVINSIPENLQHYWFRGLLDGDGCISRNQNRIQIHGPHDQNWQYLVNLCEKLHLAYKIYYKVTNCGNSSSFTFAGIDSYIRFGKYIYQNYEQDQLGLPRKYKIFQEKLSSLLRRKKYQIYA